MWKKSGLGERFNAIKAKMKKPRKAGGDRAEKVASAVAKHRYGSMKRSY